MKETAMKPSKKHAALIRQWLDGAVIESLGRGWCEDRDPTWCETIEYRVKPAEPERTDYPQTLMTGQELYEFYSEDNGDVGEGLVVAANAALRHACDNGQIVTREEFDRAVGDRKARDLAIAVAVSNAHRDGTIAYLTLADIIKGVTQ